MNRKLWLVAFLVLIMAAGLVFAGCAAEEPEEPVDPEEPEEPVDPDEPEALSVSVIVAGTLGDRSFYDSAEEGLQRSIDEYGIEGRVLECREDPAAFFDQILAGAENDDIVISVGFQLVDDTLDIAGQFPEVDFFMVDMEGEGPDNLTWIIYEEHEGSFLAGALAAKMTQQTDIEGISEEKKVGLVGGMDIPVIRNFITGFEQGVEYVDDEVEVLVAFAGDFEDPAAGKENALELYDRGADIVFQVAGKTGEGIFEAAEEAGRYAIGVDADQGWISPDHIIASMMKEVGFSIYESIGRVIDGTLDRGSVYRYGLEEDGVGLCWGDNMERHVPQEIWQELEEIEELIRTGEIVVERYN